MKYCRGRGRLADLNIFFGSKFRKRSSRALECSGPWPSKPCGEKQHNA